MARIFISHSSRNNDKAVEMRDWLAANGWDDVFLDLDPQSGIAPGELWQQALRDAADQCQAVLCLITPEWLVSGWCKAEFLLAKQLGKCVIPIIVSSVDHHLLPQDLTANHQFVDLVRDATGWDRLKEGLRRAGLDPETFAFPVGRRPYPGFEPLTEEDAAIFFGREAQIVRGLDRLRGMSEAGAERMLVILGASGAGKSSYLRAGLWPRLKRDDRNFLPLPVIRPERGVLTGKFGLFASLETAISASRAASQPSSQAIPRSRAAIGDLVNANPEALGQLLAALRDGSPAVLSDRRPSPTTIIAIDQGEELFNEEGREEADRFMDLLTMTLTKDQRVIVIFSMRSDSFPRLQAESKLATVRKIPFDLPPLPAGSIRLIIEGPARVAKPPLKLDPTLVEALMEDARGEDTLPLLAFTLGRLAQAYGAEGKLTLAQYERLGRISGAVTAAVSEALAEGTRLGLLARGKATLDDLLRRTFIPHLARVNKAGQFVRRVAIEADLPARSRAVINLFVEARLLLRDRRPVRDGDADIIEVAHEALLREWPALCEWLEADREFLIGKEKVAESAAVWRDATLKQKKDALLSGLNLARARQWLHDRDTQDLTGEEHAFIVASIAHDEAVTRRKRQAAVAAFAILLAFAGVAASQWIKAERANNVAADRLNLARNGAEDLVKFIVTDLRNIQGISDNHTGAGPHYGKDLIR